MATRCIGTASTLGGLGHFSLTARANAADVVLPDPEYDGTTGEVPSSEELYAPAPLVEGAAGIYEGLPSGLLVASTCSARRSSSRPTRSTT